MIRKRSQIGVRPRVNGATIVVNRRAAKVGAFAAKARIAIETAGAVTFSGALISGVD